LLKSGDSLPANLTDAKQNRSEMPAGAAVAVAFLTLHGMSVPFMRAAWIQAISLVISRVIGF
jgi:hypothetical protein